MICINKNSFEYLSLKNRANIHDSILDPICRMYLDKYDRFPYLDELPGVNSEHTLRKDLKITKNNSASIDTILKNTNTESIEESIIDINNNYRDLEVDIIPIVDNAIVNIKHRPISINEDIITILQDSSVSNFMVFGKFFHKLAEKYGIKFKHVTDAELNSPEWEGKIPDGSFVNGFIYNGEIYLNTDRMSVDTPIHEIMHLLIGGLRFHEPKLYQQLVSSVEHWDDYALLAEEYGTRSRNDLNEEIFVTEVAKLLAGVDSNLLNATDKVKHEIQYNVLRLLDSMIMGQNSVKTISTAKLFNMSLKEIASYLNSEEMINNFHGTFNEPGSSFHRKLNNMKAELMKKNELIEHCE